MAATTGTATILFTDLVDSTRLRVSLGEQQADKLRRRYDAALADTVTAHHGRVVKGSGDGIVAAFEAASDALAAAVAMQQAVDALGRRRRLGLAMRIGISAGDVSWEEGDCFGLPVVEAARLESAAQPGQILCAEVVRVLARGRSGARFDAVGELTLKGLTDPVPACAVGWEPSARAGAESVTPLVGRAAELGELQERWQAAVDGSGGLVLLSGDAGVGKSRLLAELVTWVEDAGGQVWSGTCHELSTRAYGAFAEALDRFAPAIDPAELADLLGEQASLLARISPRISEALPGLRVPTSVPPEDERNRLHDAVALVVERVAQRRPLLLVLDDCHWADQASVELAALLARRTARRGVLVVIAYRDTEVDERHPLAAGLPAMRREAATTSIDLGGLDPPAVAALVDDLAEQRVPQELVDVLMRETGGKPFFVRELVLHLLESDRASGGTGAWMSGPPDELDIPVSVRDLVERRLARLPEDARRVLAVGSAFDAGFPLAVVAAVAGVAESDALDAVDDCLNAQILRPGEQFDSYDFTHALVRHAVYAGQNPSRRARLHRAIGEQLAGASEDGSPLPDPLAVARHYQRSAALPGAERGVPYALAAADRAAARHVPSEEHAALAVALALLGDRRDERVPVVQERAATAALVARLDLRIAVEHAQVAVHSAFDAAGAGGACRLVVQLGRLAERIDLTAAWDLGHLARPYVDELELGSESWVQLRSWELNEGEYRDPTNPGIPLDTAERRAVNDAALRLEPRQRPAFWTIFPSRRAVIDDVRSHGGQPPGSVQAFVIGDYRAALISFRSTVDRAIRRGLFSTAMWNLGLLARTHLVLGDIDEAARVEAEASALLDRVEPMSNPHVQFASIAFFRMVLADEAPADAFHLMEELLPRLQRGDLHWLSAGARLLSGWAAARAGLAEAAMEVYPDGLTAAARALVGAPNLTQVICGTADILWRLARTDRIDAVERTLLAKVVEPDLYYAETDGRWAMGQVCALTGRLDEARGWFQQGLDRVTEQGARLLIPHIACDAALAEVRAGGRGDTDLARRRLAQARAEIDRIGLPGLLPRVERVAGDLGR